MEMKKSGLLFLFALVMIFTVSGCAEKKAYFGVPNRSLTVPLAFDETERVISEAERSPGAAYCPEKIAEAKKLAKEGVETWWACRDEESMAKLRRARELAEQAKLCQPKAMPAPAKVTPPPPPPPPAPAMPDTVIAGPFAFDSTKLDPAVRTVLDREADMVKGSPDIRLEIYGHTDSIGTKTYNMALSKRRAEAVKGYLVTKGVAANRMTTIGVGEDQPVGPNKTPADRAKNRRVVIKHIR